MSPGQVFFALTMAGIGILGLVQGAFTPSWSGIPRSFPARVAVAYLCAIISLLCGIGMLWKRSALTASRVLLGFLLFWLVVVRVYGLLRYPGLGTFWSIGDTAAMAGAAWVVYARLAGDTRLRIARALYGLGMIPLGIAHFMNFKGTAAMVPGWLPWHEAFAFLTGCAFIVAGVAIVINVYARLAVTLSVVQMGLFLLLVWVPIVVAGANAGQWQEFVGSWVLVAAGWAVADSWRVAPGEVSA